MYTPNYQIENLLYTHIPDIASKRVILRTCLNVPLNPDGSISDFSRINEAMPLIRELSSSAKSLLVLAHLGRPGNATYQEKYTLKRVFDYIQSELAKDNLQMIMAENLEELDISFKDCKNVMLDNIRFFAGEDSTDETERDTFAKQISSFGDVFINDAFADYRVSASTYSIAKFLPSYIGPVFAKEVKALTYFSNPKRPFVAILGGSKLSEKLDTLMSLAETADKIIIGGAMAYTLLKAMGVETGKSLIEADKLDVATEIVKMFSSKIILPIDHVVSENFDITSKVEAVSVQDIPEDKIAIDIGNGTIKEYEKIIESAGSILWNGPMGVFEWPQSLIGTEKIAHSIIKNKGAFKLAGGGDTISAINKFKVEGFDSISTGGGAMLAFISSKSFPTLDVIGGGIKF